MKCYYELEVGEVLTIEMGNRGFCRIKAVEDEFRGRKCQRCILNSTDGANHCTKFLCQEEMRVAYGKNIHFEVVE